MYTLATNTMTQVSLPRGVLRKLLLQYSDEINDLLISLGNGAKRSAEDTLIPVTIPFSRTIVQSDEYKNNLVYPQEQANSGFIYLIHIREFLTTGQNVYKIGRTQQKDLKRFKTYPNGSELLFHAKCNDCVKSEKYLIKLFTESFTLMREYGNEYFQGELSDMLRELHRFMLEASPVNPSYSQLSSSSSLSDEKQSVSKTTIISKSVSSIRTKDVSGKSITKDSITKTRLQQITPKSISSSSPIEVPVVPIEVPVVPIDVPIPSRDPPAIPIVVSPIVSRNQGRLRPIKTNQTHTSESIVIVHKELSTTSRETQVCLDTQVWLRAQLKTAVSDGNIQLLEHLFNTGANIHFIDEYGKTYLHDTMDIVVCTWLLSKGVKQIPDNGGNTPLLVACGRGRTEVAIVLLQDFDGIRSIDIPNNDGHTPLIRACMEGNIEIVSLLLQYPEGVQSITKNDKHGSTPLLWACSKGYAEIVKALLQYYEGIESIIQTNGNCTPLSLACQENNIKIVTLLLQYPDGIQSIMQADSKGMTPLIIACAKGYIEIVKLLLRYREGIQSITQTDINATPLAWACAKGYIEIVNLLLQYPEGVRSILQANSRGVTPLIMVCHKEYVEIANLLLKYPEGIQSVSYTDTRGNNPLSIACSRGHEEMVNLLLQHSN